MSFKEIEYAGFASWPSLEQSEAGGVVLRSANGYTKRANSANIIGAQDGDFAETVDKCEKYFSEKSLPCIFRLASFCNNKAFDNYLDQADYSQIDRSLVLYRSLEDTNLAAQNIVIKPCGEWFESYCRISGSDISERERHLEILNRIEEKMLMAVLLEEGEEVSCGMGVVSNGYFGLFDIATSKDLRGRGYGEKLVNGMLAWAIANGVSESYLQVVADNIAAVKLYEKLGYQYCYEYWYRIKE